APQAAEGQLYLGKTRSFPRRKCPRRSTLTAVYDPILEDLVFPSEIVGKKILVKLDVSQLIKISTKRKNWHPHYINSLTVTGQERKAQMALNGLHKDSNTRALSVEPYLRIVLEADGARRKSLPRAPASGTKMKQPKVSGNSVQFDIQKETPGSAEASSAKKPNAIKNTKITRGEESKRASPREVFSFLRALGIPDLLPLLDGIHRAQCQNET
ncbi:hypothetical protein A6R68_00837, partial [Neotoma lepida]